MSEGPGEIGFFAIDINETSIRDEMYRTDDPVADYKEKFLRNPVVIVKPSDDLIRDFGGDPDA